MWLSAGWQAGDCDRRSALECADRTWLLLLVKLLSD
jgi:hypothetical protein